MNDKQPNLDKLTVELRLGFCFEPPEGLDADEIVIGFIYCPDRSIIPTTLYLAYSVDAAQRIREAAVIELCARYNHSIRRLTDLQSRFSILCKDSVSLLDNASFSEAFYTLHDFDGKLARWQDKTMGEKRVGVARLLEEADALRAAADDLESLARQFKNELSATTRT